MRLFIKVFFIIIVFLCPVYASIDRAVQLNNIGISYLEAKNYKEAIDNLTKAHSFLPNDETIKNNLIVAYNNYALILYKDNKLNEAVYVFQKALSLNLGTVSHVLRENLADIYNEEGIKFFNQKKLEMAAENFERAAAVNRSLNIIKNLGMTYSSMGYEKHKQNNSRDAKHYLLRAIELMPENTNALSLLGLIEYNSQNLRESKGYLERALNINPGLKDAAQLLEKLNREIKYEESFQTLQSFNFDIRFEGIENTYDIQAVLYALEDAYNQIGLEFNYFPDEKTMVIIYDDTTFRSVTDAPHWVSGLYDGKIRIPIIFIRDEIKLKQLIFHEYTHAVVRRIAGMKVPTFIDEGLAKFMENKIQGRSLLFLKEAAEKNQLKSMPQLSKSFLTETDPEKVRILYGQSEAYIRYLSSNYGFFYVVRILKKIKDTPFEQVIQEELYITAPELEKRVNEYILNLK